MTDAPASRILITGGTGFVGRVLVGALREAFGDGADIVTGAPEAAEIAGARWVNYDAGDVAGIRAAVEAVRPTAVFNLAGMAHVVGSARDPGAAWRVNALGTAELVEAVLDLTPDCRFIHVSSGEVYGLSANDREAVDETAPLQPANVYAATKAAGDLAVGEGAVRGLRAVRFRPFNHTGPGQSPDFVVPGVARQIAMIEAGLQAPTLRLGATDRARDFLDVRDVCAAYVKGLQRIDDLAPGAVFNIASGTARPIASVVEALTALSPRDIAIETDAAKLRAGDVARIQGDAGRARAALDWTPTTPWEDTLSRTLDYWRTRVAQEAAA